MSGVEIQPFSDQHLDAAARLLAARHEQHRRALPLLAADDLVERIERERGREEASAFVACRGDIIVGYLIGYSLPPLLSMHVGSAGHAVAEPEIVRDLYAFAAASWAEAGHLRHTVNVPATDAGLVDAWFRLSFGQQAAYAIREVTAERPIDAGVVIRAGNGADVEVGVRLQRVLSEQHTLPPVFSQRTPRTDDEIREEWREALAEEGVAFFIAESGGEAVGGLLLSRTERDFVDPATNIDLSFAATTPEVRGSGVGRALTARALRWAAEEGYRTMTADWRIANLLASRFWPRRGFRPAFLRLYRSIP